MEFSDLLELKLVDNGQSGQSTNLSEHTSHWILFINHQENHPTVITGNSEMIKVSLMDTLTGCHRQCIIAV